MAGTRSGEYGGCRKAVIAFLLRYSLQKETTEMVHCHGGRASF
jgi:hypothetical protein